ncbi:hypothetical protein Tco_0639738 [Tanacetum coccineum]
MHTTMVPEQVKTMKIQAGIQVSRPGELKRQLQLWKRFGRLYSIVFVLVRNIIAFCDWLSSNTTLGNHIAHPHCEVKKAQQNQNPEAGKRLWLEMGVVFRTRLTPVSLEMCMCLKDHLDAKERKQDKCPLETPLDFEEFDDEVKQNEVIPLSDEEIALDASSEGTMSPGGPRYDYMLSSEAEDDY